MTSEPSTAVSGPRLKSHLAIGSVVGAVCVAALSVLALTVVLQAADALDAEAGVPRQGPRVVPISFLFGLVDLGETEQPYPWYIANGLVMGALYGGVIGLVIWGIRSSLFRSRANRRAGSRQVSDRGWQGGPEP